MIKAEMSNNILETIKDDIVDKELNKFTIPDGVEYVGLYFSAHWCPPCRNFTPVLSKYYQKYVEGKDENGKDINEDKKRRYEIVFISSDRDAGGFKEYFDTMPWKALQYDNRDLKNTISQKYEVTWIPTLIIVDRKTGDLVTKDGLAKVQNDEYWAY